MKLLARDFAVILLDVQMPDLDGFETAELIRARDKTRYTPIIFLTAFNQNDRAMLQGYSLGAVDFLFKPIVPEILRSKVQVFVELNRKTHEIRRQARLIRDAETREHTRLLGEERQALGGGESARAGRSASARPRPSSRARPRSWRARSRIAIPWRGRSCSRTRGWRSCRTRQSAAHRPAAARAPRRAVRSPHRPSRSRHVRLSRRRRVGHITAAALVGRPQRRSRREGARCPHRRGHVGHRRADA